VPGPYSLRIKKSAERELRQVPKPDVRRVVRKIAALAQDPRPPGCQKLFGENGYRLRQGDYRILYTLDDDQRVVEIIKIGHRREVYR
jgi:mRNA interferase RelE/StbE